MEDATLLEATISRLEGILDLAAPMLICNQDFRFITEEQVLRCGTEPEAIVLEPMGRNTAPAVAIAAHYFKHQGLNVDLLVLPSDHVIRNPTRFVDAVNHAAACSHQHLVTFGIQPDHPETGYGYIHAVNSLESGVLKVDRFVEKPDAETARLFLDSGEYYWNSGMFMFSSDLYLEHLETYAPEVDKVACQCLRQSRREGNFVYLDETGFSHSPNISIDYAVMEHAPARVVIPLDAGWFDVGSWKGVWDASDHDADGNVTRGNVRTRQVSQSYLSTSGRMLVINGLENVAVVDTKDVTFVTTLDQSQEVKEMVEQLKQEDAPEVDLHSRVLRPWGAFESIDSGPGFQVKRLTIAPGSEISLQYHHHRAEHWVVVRGRATVTKGKDVLVLGESESIYIPVGTIHKLANEQDEVLEIIEVQTGSYLGEDDIVRLEDRYGRLEEVVK